MSTPSSCLEGLGHLSEPELAKGLEQSSIADAADGGEGIS